jgi:hypothetical protein
MILNGDYPHNFQAIVFVSGKSARCRFSILHIGTYMDRDE